MSGKETSLADIVEEGFDLVHADLLTEKLNHHPFPSLVHSNYVFFAGKCTTGRGFPAPKMYARGSDV